ncbi:hypothetical protein BJ742DRAFT_154399 [Cladochytrium replicatum]|nr:hypothetical protein BJ742DRAFT_154399 [Cladochytrium replicatum]
MAGRTRVVFVGNIPYDLTEPQLTDIFSSVGPVVSFRLVFDRETGKPKGYGFCTFQDPETAASAVRNLNNYDVEGRPLRVDFSESEKDDEPRHGSGGGRGPPPAPLEEKVSYSSSASAPAASGPPSADIIKQILGALSAPQLLEVLASMKMLSQTNPEQCRLLLIQNPQLTYAIFQALLLMNVVEANLMQRVVQAGANPGLAMGLGVPPAIQAPAFLPQAPIPLAPPQTQPVVPAPVPGMASMADIQEQQKQLLLQVLKLTPEQIDQLPPDQRQKVLQLRQHILPQT